MSAPAKVATCWATPDRRPPMGPRGAPSAAPADMAHHGHGLVELVRDSLARGHHKVAVRRALMLAAAGAGLPRDLTQPVETAMRRCSPAELRTMWRDAADWALMVCDGCAPASALQAMPWPRAVRGAAPIGA